jgi:hypothetical protein
MKVYFIHSRNWLIFIIILLAACNSNQPSSTILPPENKPNTLSVTEAVNSSIVSSQTPPFKTNSNTPQPTAHLVPIETGTPTKSFDNVASTTPSPTLDPAYQSWHSTAVAVETEYWSARIQTETAFYTRIGQFPEPCDANYGGPLSLSPDGNWYATSCRYGDVNRFVIQNKEGVKWILYLPDFITSDAPNYKLSNIIPIFWSLDGNYLYFSTSLGYDGGGSQCFHGFGAYGLFRINLDKGTWSTLIPPTNKFPGYMIKFSPNGRYFAYESYGIRIIDLINGDITQVAISNLYDFNWSPDGEFIAYSTAVCGDWAVQTSSMYIYNLQSNRSEKILSINNELLQPEEWINNSTLRFISTRTVVTHENTGDRYNDFYTVYEYDINHMAINFTATATPHP